MTGTGVSELDRRHMRRAIQLARLGLGHVEPNPMVGCVVARGASVLSEGWHARFGSDHAEIVALKQLPPTDLREATLYVTLEPCYHYGKTPPCVDAILRTEIPRIVVAIQDPFPAVAGQGIARLQQAGRTVEVGLLSNEAAALIAPFRKLMETGRPWVIAKWAMTLDGKIATAHGESRWISNDASRAIVHRLRGRMDAIAVGSRTAERDDPLLTARPPGSRVATRIVFDRRGALSADSQLVRSIDRAPVMVVAGPGIPSDARKRLEAAGCELFLCSSLEPPTQVCELLDALGSRRMTNILVEGGGQLLGSFLDAREVDEVHVFVSPRVMGGLESVSPVAGSGAATIDQLQRLGELTVLRAGSDVYLHGRVTRTGAATPTFDRS